MNTGAFGENFPYSNFHDLNMDWIIKIAKDFLDQYTHIQEIIEQGKTDIQALTDSGLTQLQDKADALEEALQEWYNEHSEDIANQLVSALADMDSALTSALGDISSALSRAISNFNTAAENKAIATIATIPDDYSSFYAEAIKGNRFVTSGTYATVLPDLNDALKESVYVLHMLPAGNKPAHVPDSSINYDMAVMLTTGGRYYTQIIWSKDFCYVRNCADGTWSNWSLVHNFNGEYNNIMQSNVLVTSGNYATVLSDLDGANSNSIFTLNFASAGNKPAHVPDASISYDMAILLTTGKVGSYKTQVCFSKDFLYKRVYDGDAWGDWALIMQFPDVVKGNKIITSANYASVMPSLDDAPVNTIYTINFASSGNKPTNLPVQSIGYSMSTLMTMGVAGSYKTQIVFDNRYFWKRVFDGTDWGNWITFFVAVPETATPLTLIPMLKSNAGTGRIIYLNGEVFDIYEMYKAYYGNDFWTNYEGYEGQETMYQGLFIDGVTLIGSGTTKFTFSGETNYYISRYFSFFVFSGNCGLENVKIAIGTSKVRYAIHDDATANNSRVHMKNIVFSGTPYNRSVIGGGMGLGCTYEITGCIFLNNSQNEDISYHSNAHGTLPCTIFINNCYGSKKCVFLWYGDGTEQNICTVSNSKFSQITAQAHDFTPHDIENITLVKYLCDET